MKKILLSVILLAAFGVCVTAQEKTRLTTKSELSVSIAGYPLAEVYRSDYGGFYHDYIPGAYRDGLYDRFYGDYAGNCYVTGTMSVDFTYRFKGWIGMDVQANLTVLTESEYSSVTDKKTGTENNWFISVLPYVRFTFVNREKVTLYASVGAGIGTCVLIGDVRVVPEVQLIPIGVTVGKKIYGRFELGVGSVYCGGKMGIGFRF